MLARREKHFIRERERYQEELRKPIEVPKFTAEELSMKLKKQYVSPTDQFRIDDDNREAVKLLCYYFTDDPRFEQDGRSLKKGLLLFGGVGVGKSVIMTLLQHNQKQSFRLISCFDVVTAFTSQSQEERKYGENPLARFCGDLHAPISGNPFGHRRLGICFDDLGLENPRAMFYGEAKNCMEEVLWTRHKSGEFTKTHITTNLSGEELEKVYGARVRDRMKEMFNVIAWPLEAKSRRV